MRLRNRRTSPASFVAAPEPPRWSPTRAPSLPRNPRATDPPALPASHELSKFVAGCPRPRRGAPPRDEATPPPSGVELGTPPSGPRDPNPRRRRGRRGDARARTRAARRSPGTCPEAPARRTSSSARRPSGESRFPSLRSIPVAARRSPRVSAPSDCNRRATAAAKRRSPPRLVLHITYSGPLV